MNDQRIGIFGGTFDPPHLGHLVTAVNVRFELDLDRVLFVVANLPWQKMPGFLAESDDGHPISAAPDRLAMVEAAVAGIDGLEASSVEIDRGGPSYTADTLAGLASREPNAELFVIVGRDAAAGVPTWERAGDLGVAASLVVVDRPGAEMAPLPEGFDWRRVEVPRVDVSSTELRNRVETGRPLDFLLRPAVIACIRERRLYCGKGS